MVRLLSVTCESLQATHERVTWEKVGTRAVTQGTAYLGNHFSILLCGKKSTCQQRRRHGFNP